MARAAERLRRRCRVPHSALRRANRGTAIIENRVVPPRICVVTDIHHGRPLGTKRGDTALRLLTEAAKFARTHGADLVIDLGDRITDADRVSDIRLEREVAEAFRQFDVAVHHINGNHDRDHLQVADNEAVLDQQLLHETIDLGAWRIVLWRADTKFHRGGQRGFHLPGEDIAWLEAVVAAADRPLLVASHVPVSGHTMIGNHYFEREPEAATYPQSDRVRALLFAARVPIVCIAGHVHWNTICNDGGVVHLTQQSLTESCTTGGEPAGAIGLLELQTEVHWRVTGRDPFEARFVPRAERWMPPLS